MNWIDTLNHLIEYLEGHLDEKISPRQVELITGCQYNVFQRAFSYIAGITINEYLRRRKLSEAVYDLQVLNAKVIDVAVKYGYESSDAFCVAFKKQHGITPIEAKQPNSILKSYPRLVFSLSITGGNAMKYQVVEKEEMKVVGVLGDVNQGLWEQVKSDGTLEELEAYCMDNISLGLCWGYDEDGKNTYMVAVQPLKNIEVNPRYETYVIPAASWLIFKSVGPIFPTLQDTWKRIYGEFLPSNQYKQNPDIPTIEKYYGSDTDKENYTVEIWIPIMI